MKNKDRYDLREIEASVVYDISGCGRKVPDSRTIKIIHNDELLYEEKTEKSLWPVVMGWLEDES